MGEISSNLCLSPLLTFWWPLSEESQDTYLEPGQPRAQMRAPMPFAIRSIPSWTQWLRFEIPDGQESKIEVRELLK